LGNRLLGRAAIPTNWSVQIRFLASFRLPDIIFPPLFPSKTALLEEFLHGTQSKLGITDRLGTRGMGSAETHVKDYMIRYQKTLGLGEEDVQILQILRDKGL
jgi:hypothetical protein